MNITNEKVTEYIYKFYKPCSPELEELRQFAESKRIPIILKDTEAMLLSILRIKKPKRILEIGTAIGYSAACFASSFKDCHVTTIESDENAYKQAVSNIKKLNLADQITILQGDAKDVLTDLYEKEAAAGDEGFDMVFIDAAKSHYKAFWEGAIKLTKKDGVILSDNVLLKAATASDEYDKDGRFKTSIKRMREYLDYITSLNYADTSVISVGDGLAISVLRG